MKQKDIIMQSSNPPDNPNSVVPDGNSSVGVILAIAVLIGAIAKLIQVLVPVMMRDQNRK